jgi:hypothetical protein
MYMNKKSNKQIYIPIQLTRSKTVYVKRFKTQTIVLVSVGWIALCYVLILSEVISDIIEVLFSGYSTGRDYMIAILLFAPGAIGLAYGYAMLSKINRALFWVQFIIGFTVILMMLTFLIYPLGYLINSN